MTNTSNPSQVAISTITPHIVLRRAAEAIEFYKKIFGALENFRYNSPDGRIIHSSLVIGNSHLFLAEEFPERGCGCAAPETLNGTNATMHVYVDNVDQTFEKAVEAGAKVEMPPQNMFWGDRYARIVDPFGQPWALVMRVEELSPAEVQKRGREFFSSQNSCSK